MINVKACLKKLRDTKGLVDYLSDERETVESRRKVLRVVFAKEIVEPTMADRQAAVFSVIGQELNLDFGICPYFSYDTETGQTHCEILKKAKCGMSQAMCPYNDQVPKY